MPSDLLPQKNEPSCLYLALCHARCTGYGLARGRGGGGVVYSVWCSLAVLPPGVRLRMSGRPHAPPGTHVLTSTSASSANYSDDVNRCYSEKTPLCLARLASTRTAIARAP